MRNTIAAVFGRCRRARANVALSPPRRIEVTAVVELGEGRAIVFGADTNVVISGASRGQLEEIRRVGIVDVVAIGETELAARVARQEIPRGRDAA